MFLIDDMPKHETNLSRAHKILKNFAQIFLKPTKTFQKPFRVNNHRENDYQDRLHSYLSARQVFHSSVAGVFGQNCVKKVEEEEACDCSMDSVNAGYMDSATPQLGTAEISEVGQSLAFTYLVRSAARCKEGVSMTKRFCIVPGIIFS